MVRFGSFAMKREDVNQSVGYLGMMAGLALYIVTAVEMQAEQDYFSWEKFLIMTAASGIISASASLARHKTITPGEAAGQVLYGAFMYALVLGISGFLARSNTEMAVFLIATSTLFNWMRMMSANPKYPDILCGKPGEALRSEAPSTPKM